MHNLFACHCAVCQTWPFDPSINSIPLGEAACTVKGLVWRSNLCPWDAYVPMSDVSLPICRVEQRLLLVDVGVRSLQICSKCPHLPVDSIAPKDAISVVKRPVLA